MLENGRRVAGVLAALAAVLTVTSCGRRGGGNETAQLPPLHRFIQQGVNTLQEPLVIRSVPTVVGKDTIGILDATLAAVMDTTILPGDTLPADTTHVVLRAYKLIEANGKAYNEVGTPGPTFWVHPGDSVRIKLVNQMPNDPTGDTTCITYPAVTSGVDHYPDCFHGSNFTNIHYHGSHISPQGSGDNVLVMIGPDSSWQSAFRIPMNQSPGTMWYHPHKHGSVAMQVVNGMAGALVIEGGGLDSLTRALHMTQHLLAVQNIATNLNLIDSTLPPSVPLVDGQSNPTIIMRPGEVQRWRFVNENAQTTVTYKLLFADTGAIHPLLFDVARDGIQYAPANYDGVHADSALFVAPGNRLDVFVRAPSVAGTYHLKARPAGEVQSPRLLQLESSGRFPGFSGPGSGTGGGGGRGRRGKGGGGGGGGGAGAGAAVAQLGAPFGQQLLTVVVQAGPVDTVDTIMPKTLPPLPKFLANLDTVTKGDTAAFIEFSDSSFSTKSHKAPTEFWLGTKANPRMRFNPDSVFLHMPLGATQTWKVLNSSLKINHPVHIHINPFQILKVVFDPSDPNAAFYREVNADAARGSPLWMDTFALPRSTAKDTAYIVIRQHYADFTGQYVIHCHILGHEERGMMQLLEVDSTQGKVIASSRPKGGG